MTEIQDLQHTVLTVERNKYLKLQGTVDTNIYFVKTGSLRLYIPDAGEDRIIRFGYKNNLIVSLDSFLTEKSSDLCIQALKKTTVRLIRKRVFFDFINESEKNRNLWIKILEDLVIQQIEREKDLLISSPKERYQRVLKRSPELFQEIPEKHIANYLRMSPETLSRLKNS